MQYAYDPATVEKKWRQKWNDADLHTADLKKAKRPYYALAMFPYPSGDKLHVGHWYNFAPADTSARFMRMKGYDVFEPMGFDAFGLPAENYAIKTGVPPQQSIQKNVETMIEQLSRIGTMYDWKRMVNTSSPEYYRWTQWLFLKMYEHGLSYKKTANVNWCPKDQTVLANEQVQDGKCERCGTEVIQKNLEQWFWKITDYNQKLLDGLETVDWPEKTKLMQRNWIGKSQGAEIEFKLVGHDQTVKVFTTRPDTLFGVTYVVLAPEHELVDIITTKDHVAKVAHYREEVRKKTQLQRETDKTKTGVPTGAFVINPATQEKIPVWIADYALVTYGTGAVMAVPAHDERDFDFAVAHHLPRKTVIRSPEAEGVEGAWTGGGTMVESGFLNGIDSELAKQKMIAWLEDKACGRGLTTYRLRDWLISRQRYWGAPIPIVYDPAGKAHPVPEKHLPWLLPTDVEFKPNGESPLKLSKEFKERTETLFDKGWTPEYDTMDTFVCSSFYYLRYLMEGDPKHFVDPKLERTWLPVSMYIGGPEHACMHLIYARFVMMALKDFGVVSHSEPFQKLVHQGLITHQGAKMSKSKGNVVSPDVFVERHGADVFRMYLMFMGPFTDGGDWSDSGIKGVDRFVQRVWKLLSSDVVQKKHVDEPAVRAALHKTIKSVTESLDGLRFNTAISALMELLNFLESQPAVSADTAKTVSLLLGPLAPHLADELWEHLGGKGFIVEQSWPTFDPSLLVTDTLSIAVQVNGKLRGQVEVSADAAEDVIFAAAKAEPNVAKFLEGQAIKKQIYVKGRLVSFVI